MNEELIRSLGMALFHSLWEGVIILMAVWTALALAGKGNARIRYLILVTGHGLMVTGFLITWLILYKRNIEHTYTAQALNTLAARWQGIMNAHASNIHPETFSSFLDHLMEPVYPAIATGWFLGFLFMVFRMTGGLYFSYSKARKDMLDPGTVLADLFDRLKARLGMPSSLELKLSSRLISPMVIGILKPCVVIPAAILSGLNPGQVEAIMVHELAHIRRFDHVIAILQAVVTRIFFFHPVAWFLSSEINKERENCCDDLVVKTFEDPINYIKALTMIQELNMEGYVPANALLGKSKKLLGRIRRLLKNDEPRTPVFRFAVAGSLLAVVGLATITLVTAGKPESPGALSAIFTVRQEKPQAVADTLKKQRHPSREMADQQTDQKLIEKKQKDLEEATRKLEKAQLQVVWAQREVEKAMEEMERAGGRMRQYHMADMEAHRNMMQDQERMFRMRNDQIRMRMDMSRQRQWQEMSERDRQEMSERDRQEMKKQWDLSNEDRKMMRDFRLSRKDSMFFRHPHSFFPAEPPVPGFPPSPDVMTEPVPGVDMPAPPAPPEELMREDSIPGRDIDRKLQELEEK